MKRSLFYRLGIFIAVIPLFTACESLDGCMICQLNTYENGVLFSPGPEAEYCGAELAAIRATPVESDPPYEYRWECR